MPPDLIANWLLSVGLDPEAVVFAVVAATLSTFLVVVMRAASTK